MKQAFHIEVINHPHAGVIRKCSTPEGTYSYYAKHKRMTFSNHYGEVSYPMMTKDNKTVWEVLRED